MIIVLVDDSQDETTLGVRVLVHDGTHTDTHRQTDTYTVTDRHTQAQDRDRDRHSHNIACMCTVGTHRHLQYIRMHTQQVKRTLNNTHSLSVLLVR